MISKNNQIRKILLLAANPRGSSQLRLGEEMREIKEGLKRSKHRDQYLIVTAEAVRYRDIHRAILDYEPHIIHFCGHGSGEDGLLFEDESGQIKLVDAKALAGVFELFAEQIECVVLNACYSEYQALEIARHIDYVVGMSQEIGDKAAIEFAVGFYDALGANRDYEFAYELGRRLVRMAGIAENLIPQLIKIKTAITEVTGIQTPPELLFDLLFHMDFKQQAQLVKKVMDLHRTAAFLVHGEPYCGQQVLVNRLLRLKPEWKNISPIKIDVSHNGAGRSIPHLWRQLASWFRLPKDIEPKEIIHKICDRLFTQDVILILYTVDYMLPKILTAWLQEFWEPLVAQVLENYPPTQRDKHLLMFLVDNSGRVCESNILLAKQFDEPEYPRIPLHLPPVSPFSLEVLDDWIDMVTAMGSMQIPTGLTSKIVLEKTENGIPEFVYEEICCHCGHSWEGGLAKWLI